MTQYQPITVKVGGQTYNGSWQVIVGMVHVSSAYGSDTAPAGQKPQATAEHLLIEIIQRQRK